MTPPYPDWLKAKELRSILRLGENQLRAMLREGLIPQKFIRKIGRRDMRFSKEYLAVNSGR